jgi:long-chain acyl-CoA synthetase
VVAALGAWRLGAVVVPADPRGPAHAAERTALRAGAAAVALGPDDVRVREGAAPREHDPRAALVLSTSGSSAEPKLVLLGRDGIGANVRAILRYLPVRRAPRTAVVVPLSYSYGLVGQVLTTLESGGALLLLGDVPFATTQIDRMRALGAEGLSTVPSAIRLLARAALDEGGAPLPLAYVASAGAALDAATVDLARAAFPGATLFDQYGLTEASPRVTALSDREPPFARRSAGRALEGLEVFAVDEGGARCPPGVEGEIAVRGPSVMLGYLDDAEATARALLADGALRTGDRGHVDDDGYLYVAGRRDGVVKVSGERVSLEEIAATLRRAPGVRDAAVVAVPHADLGAELHAFLEAEGEAVRAARELARAELSPAKRPTRIVAIAALPRTTSGKIALGELDTLARRPRG